MPEFSSADHTYIRKALELAMKPVCAPHPNPRVGCVIVNNEKIVGEGFHREAGLAHAEVDALDSCGEQSKGGVMYVTLEPCTTYGRTPPCVERVIRSGVQRVVVCTEDPNPSVRGQGIRQLRESGITTEVGLLAEDARSLNKGFFSRHENGKVWVTVKVATTLDGRTATASGESAWISGEASRKDVQSLRAQASAILTGIGTIRTDNPRLNCRADGAENSPIRVIVDSNLETPVDSKIFEVEGDVIIAVKQGTQSENRQKLEKMAEIVEVPSSHDRVDCEFLMQWLAKREINEVLVEAGPALVGSLLSDELVDEMVIYVAPSLIGDGAKGIATLPAIQKLSERINVDFTEVRSVGDDIRITARIDCSS